MCELNKVEEAKLLLERLICRHAREETIQKFNYDGGTAHMELDGCAMTACSAILKLVTTLVQQNIEIDVTMTTTSPYCYDMTLDVQAIQIDTEKTTLEDFRKFLVDFTSKPVQPAVTTFNDDYVFILQRDDVRNPMHLANRLRSSFGGGWKINSDMQDTGELLLWVIVERDCVQ